LKLPRLWDGVYMVQRYTRSITFHDSLMVYKGALSCIPQTGLCAFHVSVYDI